MRKSGAGPGRVSVKATGGRMSVGAKNQKANEKPPWTMSTKQEGPDSGDEKPYREQQIRQSVAMRVAMARELQYQRERKSEHHGAGRISRVIGMRKEGRAHVFGSPAPGPSSTLERIGNSNVGWEAPHSGENPSTDWLLYPRKHMRQSKREQHGFFFSFS